MVYTDIIVYILILSNLCCVSGHVCGISVGFHWSVKVSLRIGVLEEQDGVVLGVSWPLPADLASYHWSTSNKHFRLQLPHPCSRHDRTGMAGYLVPHGCPLCGLGDQWCSSTVYCIPDTLTSIIVCVNIMLYMTTYTCSASCTCRWSSMWSLLIALWWSTPAVGVANWLYY